MGHQDFGGNIIFPSGPHFYDRSLTKSISKNMAAKRTWKDQGRLANENGNPVTVSQITKLGFFIVERNHRIPDIHVVLG